MSAMISATLLSRTPEDSLVIDPKEFRFALFSAWMSRSRSRRRRTMM
jgi:hypothetical protein